MPLFTFRPVLRHLLVATALLSGTLLSGAQAARAESRIALVIGESNYRAVTALPNPANDAKAVSQLLDSAGFEVQTASDLSQNELREKISEFVARMAAKGPDTVALVFYAGHGLQIDGENYLVPVDIDPKREADIPLQAVRLNDILNTLASVPSKMRILLLDACRNNPFPDLNATAGRGLALVDAKIGAPGTFMSFSTSPGAEAEDGNGADSPYTTALLTAAKEPGRSIEDIFRRVRVSVNKSTDGRQTPWDSSSLTDEFSFFPGQVTSRDTAAADASKSMTRKTVEDWRRELQGKPVGIANEMIVADGTEEAYVAFVDLFAQSPFGQQAREWIELHRRMVAWNLAGITNTAAGYRAFLTQYPDSDLTATARKLELRLHNRPNPLMAMAAIAPPRAQPVAATSGPTGPCSVAPLPLQKVDLPAPKSVDPAPSKPAGNARPQRNARADDDDVVVYRRPAPVYYQPMPTRIIGLGRFGGVYGGGFRRPQGRY